MARVSTVFHRYIVMTAAAVTLSLGGCSSVKLPKLDLLKLPEFKEESENIGAYPNVVDAPGRPTEVRSASDWDKTARDILRARDSVALPADPEPAKTSDEIIREIDRLTDEVNEYRADDPQ